MVSCNLPELHRFARDIITADNIVDATMPNKIAQTHAHTQIAVERTCRLLYLRLHVPFYWKRNTHSIILTHRFKDQFVDHSIFVTTLLSRHPIIWPKYAPFSTRSMSAHRSAAYRLGSDVRFRADLQPDSMEAKKIPFWFVNSAVQVSVVYKINYKYERYTQTKLIPLK